MTEDVHFVLVNQDGEVLEIFNELEQAQAVGSRRAVLWHSGEDEGEYVQTVPPSWYQMGDDEWRLDTEDGAHYVIFER
jgi:hypothetical protein